MRFLSVWFCVVLAASGVFAAPEASLRPQARGEAQVQHTGGGAGLIRPKARPAVVESALANQLAQQFRREADPGYNADPVEIGFARQRAFAALSPQATALSLRPANRPQALVEKAMAKRRARARGAVCGDVAIQGDEVGFVPGRISGCGVKNAVKVRSVSGISLSQSALMDCNTAKTLKRWVDRGAKPALGGRGGGLREIKVAASYACRTRNSQPGAKISEHGKGRAIDISAFRLRDGSEITLVKGWVRKTEGAILRKMHRAACGMFGTVLGPDSDRFHRDHFHFDTARHRGGSFCR